MERQCAEEAEASPSGMHTVSNEELEQVKTSFKAEKEQAQQIWCINRQQLTKKCVLLGK